MLTSNFYVLSSTTSQSFASGDSVACDRIEVERLVSIEIVDVGLDYRYSRIGGKEQ